MTVRVWLLCETLARPSHCTWHWRPLIESSALHSHPPPAHPPLPPTSQFSLIMDPPDHLPPHQSCWPLRSTVIFLFPRSECSSLPRDATSGHIILLSSSPKGGQEVTLRDPYHEPRPLYADLCLFLVSCPWWDGESHKVSNPVTYKSDFRVEFWYKYVLRVYLAMGPGRCKLLNSETAD